ncbi:hypothetical protein KI387_036657, partial [Taxus chinensis]
NKGGWNNSQRHTAFKTDHKEATGEAQPVVSEYGPKSPGDKTSSNKAEDSRIVVGGVKRGHESDKSDSDQEPNPDPSNDLMLVVASDQNQWHEVKKQKGKKGRYVNLLHYYSSHEER